jgi:signal transduction histidine kinase
VESLERASRGPSATLLFASGLVIATGTLVWLTWAAIGETRRSAGLLLERRASEMLALASAALNRDMRGAWLAVLVPADGQAIAEDPPYDFLQLTSRAFARFPYPETFIVWAADGSTHGRTYAFSRSDRPPAWDAAGQDTEPYPVTLRRDPTGLAPLVARLREEAREGRRYALVETRVGETPYQAVVHFLVDRVEEPRLAGFVAMTVNLDWVRREYLAELLRQVAAIDGAEGAMAIAVRDEQQQVVASSGAARPGGPVRARPLPLAFFEPALVPALASGATPLRTWTLEVRPAVGVAEDPLVAGRRTLLIASLAGAASLAALLLTVRAMRAHAELTTMKSEFVAAVTHELKTPLALVKLVGETLERGRYTSTETIREYAAILTQEERRLSHLIENLLTYSRLDEPAPMERAEPVEVAELVEDALDPFRPRLRELGFDLEVSPMPEGLLVRADRVALVQALANLVDNAIKYSPVTKSLAVAVAAAGPYVRLTFRDRGMGIAPDERVKVFDRFYRGRDARGFGSGLGLAIVRRIVAQHGGSVELDSVLGDGTTVTVLLPSLRRS